MVKRFGLIVSNKKQPVPSSESSLTSSKCFHIETRCHLIRSTHMHPHALPLRLHIKQTEHQLQKTSGVGGNEHPGLEGGGEEGGTGMAAGGVAGSGLNAIRKAHTRT